MTSLPQLGTRHNCCHNLSKFSGKQFSTITFLQTIVPTLHFDSEWQTFFVDQYITEALIYFRISQRQKTAVSPALILQQLNEDRGFECAFNLPSTWFVKNLLGPSNRMSVEGVNVETSKGRSYLLLFDQGERWLLPTHCVFSLFSIH